MKEALSILIIILMVLAMTLEIAIGLSRIVVTCLWGALVCTSIERLLE